MLELKDNLEIVDTETGKIIASLIPSPYTEEVVLQSPHLADCSVFEGTCTSAEEALEYMTYLLAQQGSTS